MCGSVVDESILIHFFSRIRVFHCDFNYFLLLINIFDGKKTQIFMGFGKLVWDSARDSPGLKNVILNNKIDHFKNFNHKFNIFSLINLKL